MRAVNSAPRIKHALPGRLRLHIPHLTGLEAQRIEALLRRVAGVQAVRATVLTSSVLIHYDPRTTNPDSLLALLRGKESPRQPDPPASSTPRRWLTPTVRHALTALAVMEQAQEPARLLVESIGHVPRLSGRAMPVEPATRLEAMLRALAAVAGLGLAGLQRLLGKSRLVAPLRGLATTTGFLALLGQIPVIRRGLYRLLGPRRTALLLLLADLMSSTLGGGVLGLGIALLEAWTHLQASAPATLPA